MASDESRARRVGTRTTREAIASDLGIPIEEIRGEARILDDFGIDSFDLQELLEALEEEFGVAFPERETASIRTVADIEHVVGDGRHAP
jgi:acyl carrier protein